MNQSKPIYNFDFVERISATKLYNYESFDGGKQIVKILADIQFSSGEIKSITFRITPKYNTVEGKMFFGLFKVKEKIPFTDEEYWAEKDTNPEIVEALNRIEDVRNEFLAHLNGKKQLTC